MQDATLDNTVGWEVDTSDRYIGGIHLRSAQLNGILQHFLQGKNWLLGARPNVDKVFLRIYLQCYSTPDNCSFSLFKFNTLLRPNKTRSYPQQQTPETQTKRSLLDLGYELSGLWRARPARISWAAVTVQTWLTAVCRSISRRRSVGRILRLGSRSYATSRLICRADVSGRVSSVVIRSSSVGLGNRLLLYVDKWISQRHVCCSVYSGPGQRCKSNVIIQRQEGEGGKR